MFRELEHMFREFEHMFHPLEHMFREFEHMFHPLEHMFSQLKNMFSTICDHATCVFDTAPTIPTGSLSQVPTHMQAAGHIGRNAFIKTGIVKRIQKLNDSISVARVYPPKVVSPQPSSSLWQR